MFTEVIVKINQGSVFLDHPVYKELVFCYMRALIERKEQCLWKRACHVCMQNCSRPINVKSCLCWANACESIRNKTCSWASLVLANAIKARAIYAVLHADINLRRKNAQRVRDLQEVQRNERWWTLDLDHCWHAAIRPWKLHMRVFQWKSGISNNIS